jgi:hypothetical protein
MDEHLEDTLLTKMCYLINYEIDRLLASCGLVTYGRYAGTLPGYLVTVRGVEHKPQSTYIVVRTYLRGVGGVLEYQSKALDESFRFQPKYK